MFHNTAVAVSLPTPFYDQLVFVEYVVRNTPFSIRERQRVTVVEKEDQLTDTQSESNNRAYYVSRGMASLAACHSANACCLER